MQTEAEIQSFLRDADWENAPRTPIAAGFSTRRFERLTRGDKTPSSAILMCADADQKTEPFVQIAALLRRVGVAAPDVYASDVIRGMVLMEDFGDEVIGALLDKGEDRAPYDDYAAHMLAILHANFKQPMLGAIKAPLYNAALFTEQAALFLDFYFPFVFHRTPSPRERSNFFECWHDVLSPLDALPRSLVLRDFMPENLIHLKTPVLKQKVGVIDFQDTGIGCIAYDIASWCEEVRRDGGIERIKPFVEAYCRYNTTIDATTLLPAVRIYAAQRHLRILGLLVKLERTAYIPRVWKVLQGLLKDPSLTPVRRWFSQCSPGPST